MLYDTIVYFFLILSNPFGDVVFTIVRKVFFKYFSFLGRHLKNRYTRTGIYIYKAILHVHAGLAGCERTCFYWVLSCVLCACFVCVPETDVQERA